MNVRQAVALDQAYLMTVSALLVPAGRSNLSQGWPHQRFRLHQWLKRRCYGWFESCGLVSQNWTQKKELAAASKEHLHVALNLSPFHLGNVGTFACRHSARQAQYEVAVGYVC